VIARRAREEQKTVRAREEQKTVSEVHEQGTTKISLFELAWTFNHIALASFGGGLSAWSREVLVVEKQWMGEEEFLSAMTMCRILPGANQVNMAVYAGTKMRGVPGALSALIGLTLLPLVFVLAMAFFYFRFKEVPAVKSVLHGASAAAVAMTVAMVIQTGRKTLTSAMPVLLATACFVLNGVLRWPLPVTLAIVAPVALIWAWPRKAAA
jgi:chromate transporter